MSDDPEREVEVAAEMRQSATTVPTKVALAERRHRVGQLYLQGWPQHRIGAELGISQATVSADLKVLQAEWLKSSLRNFDEARANEVAKIDRIEAEYWAAWERSRRPWKSRAKDEEPEPRDGNPSFLAGAERCVAMRCKLLGLDQTTLAGVSVGVTVLNAVDLRVATGEVRHPEERLAMEGGQPAGAGKELEANDEAGESAP